jgi:hypothetical protein
MINISWWTEVEEMVGIDTLVSREELWASGFEKLKRIWGLGAIDKS